MSKSKVDEEFDLCVHIVLGMIAGLNIIVRYVAMVTSFSHLR